MVLSVLVASGRSMLVWLNVEPRLDGIPSDARYQDLVRRVGLLHEDAGDPGAYSILEPTTKFNAMTE
jgi:hypothetical protein